MSTESSADQFEVSVMNATTIPVKEIGLVTARDGEPLPSTEYIAKAITGHQDFQQARPFFKMVVNVGLKLIFLNPVLTTSTLFYLM